MKPVGVAVAVLLCLQTQMRIAAAQSQSGIHIVVVAGEGDINPVGRRADRDTVVRIEDADQKPLAGASVVFTLPADGASGTFPNGDKTLVVTTDERGQASATGLRVNQVPGRLQIHVNASWRGRTARANITQFNMAAPGRTGGGSRKAVLAILAVAGAAAAGGAVALNRSKSGGAPVSSATVPVPIGIAPGAGTVGPPR